jgi:hypothetical protein
MKIDGPFAITGWDQAAYDERSDGPPLTRATVRKTYAGGLAGEGVAELLTCGELAYMGNERVSGTLDGRAGTFVIQHGAWEGGQWGHVVPGSGTGALAGLRGTIVLAHEQYSLDYELGEA